MELVTVSQIGNLRNAGAYDEAVKVGKLVLDITQDIEEKALVYLGLAEVMCLQGKTKERDEYMDLADMATKMPGLQPSLRIKYCKLRANYIRMDKKSLESEIQLLLEANALDTTDIAVINGIIHALKRLRSIDEMKKWITITLHRDLNPREKRAFLGLVFTTCFELGWYTLAIACISEHPDKESNGGIKLVRATCLNRLFSFEEARQDLENLQDDLKDNPSYYTEYIRVCLFAENPDLQKAASLFQDLSLLETKHVDENHLLNVFNLKSAKTEKDRFYILEKLWTIYFGNGNPGVGKINGIVELLLCFGSHEREFVLTQIPQNLKSKVKPKLNQTLNELDGIRKFSVSGESNSFFSNQYRLTPINSTASRVARRG